MTYPSSSGRSRRRSARSRGKRHWEREGACGAEGPTFARRSARRGGRAEPGPDVGAGSSRPPRPDRRATRMPSLRVAGDQPLRKEGMGLVRTRTLSLGAVVAMAALVLATAVYVVARPVAQVSAAGFQKVAYFEQWGFYQNPNGAV